jgi:hypothetical protein
MTAAEFLTWNPGGHQRYELVACTQSFGAPDQG